MKNRKWSGASYQRLEELKLDAPLPEEWLRFEKSAFEKYSAAKVEARKMLDAGRREEAVKLLNSVSEGIWRDAAKLLRIPPLPMSAKNAAPER